MEREEIEAMWERIKALEENQLRVCKAMAYEILLSTWNLALTALMVSKDKLEPYEKYMKPKVQRAEKAIRSAGNIDQVVSVLRAFNHDCMSFVKAM